MPSQNPWKGPGDRDRNWRGRRLQCGTTLHRCESQTRGSNPRSDTFKEKPSCGWVLLLGDAANAFSSINRITTLMNARLRFLFNTYRGNLTDVSFDVQRKFSRLSGKNPTAKWCSGPKHDWHSQSWEQLTTASGVPWQSSGSWVSNTAHRYVEIGLD
jgi:hypothetical protein